MSEVVIKMKDHGRGEVVVDGVAVPDVCAVRFSASPGRRNRVLLVLAPSKVSVATPADVEKLQ